MERAVVVSRPALVVALRDGGPVGHLIWALMITNAARPSWPGDIDIPDARRHGLLIPSKVRTAKISTVAADSVSLIGRLDTDTTNQVSVLLRTALAS